MKKSIALVLLLFGMINAEPSEFTIQQMITAIEGSDYGRVKDLIEHHQFQQDPELMNRFLICARDVVDERKGSIANRDKLIVASGACMATGVALSLPKRGVSTKSSTTWQDTEKKTIETVTVYYEFPTVQGFIGGVALSCLSLYLIKKCMHVRPKPQFVEPGAIRDVDEPSNLVSRRDLLLGTSSVCCSSMVCDIVLNRGGHPAFLVVKGLLGLYLLKKALNAEQKFTSDQELIVSYLEGVQKGLIATTVKPAEPQESLVSGIKKSGKSLLERVKGMFVTRTENEL